MLAQYGIHTNKMTSIDWRWLKKRAARYVTNRFHNTSSVSSMIEQIEWTTLEERRKHSRLLMMYKLKNNIVLKLMHQASLYQMNDPPETTSRHCAFHHARPQYGRIRYIPERSRNGTPCLTVLSLP